MYQATANQTVSGVRVRWKIIPAVTDTRRLLVRARYRDPAVPALFEPVAAMPGQARVVFEEPQRALAAGQVIALYASDASGRLLGGGFYEHIAPLVPTPVG